MKLRILHLEDNAADSELVRLSLERGGLECDLVTVNSGEEYLGALRRPDFDLILCDSGVPGYAGWAALNAAQEQCPGVPFIIVSGAPPHDDPRIRQADGAVSKSDLETLTPAIRKVLRQTSAANAAGLQTASYLKGLQQLVSIGPRLALARTRQSVIEIVRHAARNLVAADGATFVLREGESCVYVDEAAIGPLLKGRRFPLSGCISGWAMLNRQPAVVRDLYQDARIPHDAYRGTFVKSLAMVPVRALAPIGAIGVYWARPHQASSEEIELLQTLADSTAVAIESAESLAQLEQRVAERTRELQQRTTELQVLNRELQAFSHSVAHDLRAPLITIDGFSQVLLEKHSQDLNDTGRAHLDRICSGVRRMHRLINDLLDLSKVVRAPLTPAMVDLSRLAGEVLETLRQSTPDRAAELTIAPDLRAVGDAALLRIVLQNLLANAWKFTSQVQQAHIELGTCSAPSGQCAFFVRDNGAGFDPAHATNLFSPFRRLHPESQFPGSGTGLATVQRIIHRHGGEIWAEGAVGRGACFYFTLTDRSQAIPRRALVDSY